MATSWHSWALLFHISVLLLPDTMSDKFQLQPLNATALRGSAARLTATVQEPWTVMTWMVQNLLVLTFHTPNNSYPSTEQFSANCCPNTDTSCIEFTIHNVSRAQAGPVTCTVQGSLGQRTAQLEVQESGQVSIIEGTESATQDQQVEFQCAATAWFPTPTVTWTLNGKEAEPGLYTTNSTPPGDSFNSTSVLKFQAVSNTTVECRAAVPALRTPVTSSVFLVVAPKPPDWTVLVAVVVSIGGFALLVLLIIGIIFCYKRRKEKKPNYQDEIMRVRTQSQLSGVHPPGKRRGQVNTGYVPDGQTSVTPSEVADSDFFQTNASSFYEMPNVVNISTVGSSFDRAGATVDDSGFRKHRHVTIV